MTLLDSAAHFLTALPIETPNRDLFLDVLTLGPKVLQKSNSYPGHLTVSVVIVHLPTQRILLADHPKFNRYMQLGGHLEDSDSCLTAAALREAQEEAALPVVLDPIPLSLTAFPDIPCPKGSVSIHFDTAFLATTQKDDFSLSPEHRSLSWHPLTSIPQPHDEALLTLARLAHARL